MLTPDYQQRDAPSPDPLRYLLLVLLGTLLPAVLMVAYNYWLDPYRVFGGDYRHRVVEPNQSFIKMQWVLAHPDRYDTFLFGSSRVGHIDVQGYFGPKAYNFTYSDGLPREHYRNLKALIAHGVRVERVFIGLDEISYLINPDVHRDQLLRMPHYFTSGESPFDFYRHYLLRYPSRVDELLWSWILFSREVGGSRAIDFDITSTGMPLCQHCDDAIDANLEAHSQRADFAAFIMRANSYSMDAAMADIAALLELAEQEHFRLTFFFNPLFGPRYEAMNQERLYDFKWRLAHLTPFYDFSGLYPVLYERSNFYESIHYREPIAELILRYLGGQAHASEGFGARVDAANIAAHLAYLSEQLRIKSPAAYRHLVYQQRLRDYRRSEGWRPEGRHAFPQRLLETAVAGTCHIDRINGQLAAGQAAISPNGDERISVSGWFAAVGATIVVRLNDTTGRARDFIALGGLERADVARVIGEHGRFSGFQAEFPATELPVGAQQLEVFAWQAESGVLQRCAQTVRLQLP